MPVDSGAYISNIDPGGPAALAGLQAGDIITKIGDQSLDDDHPFINVLYNFSTGATTTLELIRDQETLNIQITLGEHPNP